MTHSSSSLNVMKFRLWWRRLSVSSPKMTIKTQMPLAFRMAIATVVLSMAGAIALGIYDLGRTLTGVPIAYSEEQLSRYKKEIEALTAERDQLSSTVNAADSRLNMERAAQKQLVSQVKTLESENIRLKEDLAFFESLLPNATGPAGVAIRRLKVEMVAPNQLRYRLLVMQGGKGDQQFVGNVQLAVSILQDGKDAMMIFPDGNPNDNNKFKLGFRHYQRVEGVLTLPEGVSAKLVQARVLEKGQVRAQLSTNL